MKLYQKIVAGILVLISLFLILFFRNLPTGKLWDNYSILYVNAETPDYQIVNALEQNSITDYVSLNNQYLPLTLSIYSPEVAFLKSNYDNPAFSYVQKRNAYFFDKSNKYRLYYIPAKEKSNLSGAVQILSKNNIFCGVDTSANYQFILPILILAAFGVLAYFSRNRFVFIASGIFPLVFIFCNPFFVISVSQVLILLCLFFISNVWKRKNFIKYLFSSFTVPAMILINVICGFACNYKVGLLNLAALLGTASILYLYFYLEEFIVNLKPFVPVYIISVKRISIFNRKKNIIMPVCAGISSLLLIFFLISMLGNVNGKSAKIMIPSEKSVACEELPTLDDYYQWMWNVRTAPYTSLNNFSDSNEVTYSRYVEENGKIKEVKQTFVYSQDFIDSVFEDIDNIKFESIEKVLKNQNKDFKGGYTSTTSYNTSLFGIIVLLFSYFILLFFYISIMIKKGLKK